MHNFRNGSIFFLLILKYVICEILLIYGEQSDSYHLDCIVNEDDPAIYLNNPSTRNFITKQSEFDNAILLEDFEDANNNKTYQYWKIYQYPYKYDIQLKSVQDYRWELFETHQDYPLCNQSTSFSIKLSSNIAVKFNINGDIVVEEATSNNTDNICFERSLDEKWLRLQVYQYNQTEIIAISNNEQCYQQSKGIYKLINQASDVYKDEKYNYLWTNRSRAIFNISIDDYNNNNNNNTSRICIIFFTTMCENCSLFVELRDGIVDDLILDEYFSVDKEYEWETKRFCSNSKLPSKLSIKFITSGYINSKHNFWAIDDIRLTYDGKRILKYQNKRDIRSYNCGSIDTKFDSVSILQTSKFCNQTIGKYCENYMNCTACYRKNNQTECCKLSKIIGLTDDYGESSTQLSTTTTTPRKTTTTTTTITMTTVKNSNVTTDGTITSTIISTEAISSTTTSNETINNNSSKFNKNYLYFLLLVIPIVGVVVYLYKKKKSQTPEINPPENDHLTTPDWLYNEPEYKE